MKASMILSKHLKCISTLFFSYVCLCYCLNSTILENISPPVARIIPKTDTIHGDIRVDDYFWLRNRDNPDVMEYLEAENAYTESVMKHTKDLQEQLYEEMVGRIKETDLSVPEKIDDYYYYTRTEEDKQYSIYCRRKGSMDAEEEILLDKNELAEGLDYFDVGHITVSPDHRLIAYSIDTIGSERYTLYIKDLSSDTIYAEHIPNTGYSVAWACDNRTLFYTVLDDTRRPYLLYRHELGTDPANDYTVFHEKDDAFWLYVSTTKDKKYIILESGSHTTTEIHYLNAHTPQDTLSIITTRCEDVEYYVEHHTDTFYILTNENAKNFKIMKTSVHALGKSSWKEVIPHSDSVKIDGLDVFKNYLVVFERKQGLPKIRVMNISTATTHYIGFPEPTYTFWSGKNRDFNSEILRFTYMSLITPRSVFDYNMTTKKRELKKQYEVLGGYEPSLYLSERIFAKAKDGTLVPISLVYNKESMKKNGTNPLFLTAYGAYGDSWDPYFSTNRLSILDRGFVYAIAHVRGGGEMGKYWHDEGRLLNKKNTFTDFIDCAEHLITTHYTSSNKLIISGGSAGGLLIGSVINMRPDLFKAAIANVPFVDLINTMLDPTLPLTVLEYEEWGNPNDPVYYEYMKSYSPYDNVSTKEYPHILITAGLNDNRVMYWEAAKWTARLRALKTDNNMLLLKTDMGTGHLGSSGRYDWIKDIAFEYAFMFTILGIAE